AAAPPPAPFRIVLLPFPKGLVGVSNTSGGEPEPWEEPPPATRGRPANRSTVDAPGAAPTQSAPARRAAECRSVPDVFLSPLERPVYRVTQGRPELDDEEDTAFLVKPRKWYVLGGAGIAALVVIGLCSWFNRSDHVRVYPARGQAFLDGKPI